MEDTCFDVCRIDSLDPNALPYQFFLISDVASQKYWTFTREQKLGGRSPYQKIRHNVEAKSVKKGKSDLKLAETTANKLRCLLNWVLHVPESYGDVFPHFSPQIIDLGANLTIIRAYVTCVSGWPGPQNVENIRVTCDVGRENGYLIPQDHKNAFKGGFTSFAPGFEIL